MTEVVLLKGTNGNNIYEVPSQGFNSTSFNFPKALVSIRDSHVDWHGKLGHPRSRLLNFMLDRYDLDSKSHVNPFSCDSFQYNKSKKL